MTLGRFGGSTEDTFRIRQGGGGLTRSLADEARDQLKNSPEGTPATPAQLLLSSGNYANNLLRNGDFESWSSGTSTNVPDNWTLTGSGSQGDRETTTIRYGKASLKITAALNTATDVAQSISISSTNKPYLQGRYVTFSCLVYSTTASRVFLRLDDGVTTADSWTHSGGSAWEFIHVSLKIDSSATKIESSLEISSGASISAFFDAAMLVEGDSPAGFSPNIDDVLLVPRLAEASDQITKTGATLADMANMDIDNVIVNGAQSVLLQVSISHALSIAGNRNSFQITRDGSTILAKSFGMVAHAADSGNHANAETISFHYIDVKPTAGSKRYKVQWATSGGTAYAELRFLSVAVFPDA